MDLWTTAMKESLQIEERCRITPSEAVALQAIADERSVSKSSLMRRGIQLVIELHHQDKVSHWARLPDMDEPR